MQPPDNTPLVNEGTLEMPDSVQKVLRKGTSAAYSHVSADFSADVIEKLNQRVVEPEVTEEAKQKTWKELVEWEQRLRA